MIAYYEDDSDGDQVLIHAAVPISAETSGKEGFSTVNLAEVPSAATILHRGSLETALSSYQALAKWVDTHGYRASGPAREFYLECPGQRRQVGHRAAAADRQGLTPQCPVLLLLA
ncbi:GyrI-like domain-containing protein [Amycolatopsis regifaucium]|uniref:GyrI-like domain-containing protein n=1 Tax=Amycolatopsis regifaucium TaxID=546365 RepID=UPI000AE5FDC6